MISLRRSVAIPFAVVVFGLAALSAPPLALGAVLPIAAVGAIGLTLLTVMSWWRGPGTARRYAPAQNARRVAAEDASDNARMDSDAG